MNRDTLLIVDDMEINRAILRGLFEDEYTLLEAANGEQAIMMIRQYKDSLAAVLLDLIMPVKDGYQVISDMAKDGLTAGIPVIVITSENSSENEVRAFDMGAADIIIKPFEPHVVRRRVLNAVELNMHKSRLEEMVEEQAEKLRESRDVIMDTLSSVIEHRSAETGQHVRRLRMFTKVMLEDVNRCCPEYNLNPHSISVISEAVSLHDIGKIAIPDTILNKPGRLTAEEFEIMKTHTVKGCEILSSLNKMVDKEYLGYAYNICRYHHERWNGKGYPEGLRGDNIPICAQVVGIADAYDALTTDRVYKKAIAPEIAVTMILNGECGVFSSKLLECLKNVRDDFFALTLKYSDSDVLQMETSRNKVLNINNNSQIESIPKLERMKYFAILRYIESTVLEVDMDSGIYHLVYQSGNDFDVLRSGNTFEETFRAFVEKAVHPDDRDKVLEIFNTYLNEFFNLGLMKISREYRVFDRSIGEYTLCKATILRVDIDNPSTHKILIIWNRSKHIKSQISFKENPKSEMLQTLLIGITQSLNDKWFTLTYFNDGFTNLLGYSSQEIKEEFKSRYINLIHPEDRFNSRQKFLSRSSQSCNQELEYRMVTKNNKIIWVLDRSTIKEGSDGREYINSVLTDVTNLKQVQEKLSTTMETYKIIQSQTNDIIFEWDIKNDFITYSNNWEKKFKYHALRESEIIKRVSHIFPEDLSVFSNMIDKIMSGAAYAESELRIANDEGKYIWCRIRETTQFNKSGEPIKAIGVIIDIDEEKREAQILATKAQIDSLTKLLNKNFAREKIQEKLMYRNPSDNFAMVILDLDNFKLVNDLHGHLFGDAVLAEIAIQLKNLFRSDDIISRFGGDEFLIFLQYKSDLEFLKEKSLKLLDIIKNIYKPELKNVELGCSIGISKCPQDGTDFQNLFQKCDKALYNAKMSGKNQYVIFDKSTMSASAWLKSKRPFTAGTQIKSDSEDNFDIETIIPMAFRKLYESNDMETAIDTILELVGRRFNVSRAYIFENSNDGTWCGNTFEWCSENTSPAKYNLSHISYKDDLDNCYTENFNENDIFYCPNISVLPKNQYRILESQGIRSLLQCAIRDRGKFVGFVGFDDCTISRIWTQKQIDTLSFISELLSIFLMKKRAQDITLGTVRNMRMALDNQNSWIYVIDPDNFILKYINAKALKTFPDSKIGMKCYEAFFHRTEPCEKCPAKNIRAIINQTVEIKNPILNKWSLADACYIKWGEEDSCLITCHDITKYKNCKDSKRGNSD